MLEHRREVTADLIERGGVQEALHDEEPVLAIGIDLLCGRLQHAAKTNRCGSPGDDASQHEHPILDDAGIDRLAVAQTRGPQRRRTGPDDPDGHAAWGRGSQACQLLLRRTG